MSGDTMHELSVSRQTAIEFFKFINGASLNALLNALANAATGSNLGDLLFKIMNGATAEQILNVFAATTPYINAKAGQKVGDILAQKYVVDNEILLHRLQEAKKKLKLTDGAILQLVSKQGHKIQKVINDNGGEVTAQELAEKVRGLSLEHAKALLGEHETGMKIWFKVRDSNIIGIVLAGTTTMLLPSAVIPANPFFASLARGGIGYTTAVLVEKFPQIKHNAWNWWSNRANKEGDKKPLLQISKAVPSNDPGYESGESMDTQNNSAAPSDDEGENQQSINVGGEEPQSQNYGTILSSV